MFKTKKFRKKEVRRVKFFTKHPEITALMSSRRDGDLRILDRETGKIVNVERRRFFFRKHGIPTQNVYAALLDHGNICQVVSRNPPRFLSRTDALITSEGGIFLEIRSADCHPVLFYEPRAQVIGIAHLGWRGIANGLVFSVISQMEKIGASRSNILIEIGHGLCQDHFEFGLDLAKKHLEKYLTPEFFRPGLGGKVYFHLAKIIVNQLSEKGINKYNISPSGKCTHCEDDLFSRRRGDAENMSVVIGMKRVGAKANEFEKIKNRERIPQFAFAA